MCCGALAKNNTKSMTEKNGGTARQVCNSLCALAGGLLSYSNKRKRFIFYLFFSSKGFGRVSMYQGEVIISYYLISAYQGKVSNDYFLISMCQGGVSKGYFTISMCQDLVSMYQGKVYKDLFLISKGYKTISM